MENKRKERAAVEWERGGVEEVGERERGMNGE